MRTWHFPFNISGHMWISNVRATIQNHRDFIPHERLGRKSMIRILGELDHKCLPCVWRAKDQINPTLESHATNMIMWPSSPVPYNWILASHNAPYPLHSTDRLCTSPLNTLRWTLQSRCHRQCHSFTAETRAETLYDKLVRTIGEPHHKN